MKKLMLLLSIGVFVACSNSSGPGLTQQDISDSKDTKEAVSDTTQDQNTDSDNDQEVLIDDTYINDSGDVYKELPSDTKEDIIPKDSLEDTNKDVSLDTEKEIQVDKIHVQGRVWKYMATGIPGKEYTYEPVGKIEVSLFPDNATTKAISTTTEDKDCSMWWTKDNFDCGAFSFDIEPKDIKSYELAITDNIPATMYPTRSQIFYKTDLYTFLLLIDKGIINAAQKLWNISWDHKYGLVIGLIVNKVDPEKNPPIQGFIGNATVQLKQPPNNKNFQIIYFDSSNLANTHRTSTDPEQSLFFMVNIPTSQTYTLTVKHEKYTFKPVQFTPTTDHITYLLITPQEQN